MSIVITGATGRLGTLVVDALISRGVPPENIVAGGRSEEKLGSLAERGVDARHLDYGDIESVRAALEGAERMLLISGPLEASGRRVEMHRTVLDQAVIAGVSRLAYTSITRADTTPMVVAHEHAETERLIRASGMTHSILRNCWYLENYLDRVETNVKQGRFFGCAASGRVSPATRAEFAEGAAVALLDPSPNSVTWELGGDTSFSMSEWADEMTSHSGQTVVYQDMTQAKLATTMESAGLPVSIATIFADSDAAVARGELEVRTRDLSRLIGRPTETLAQAMSR